MRRRLAGLHGRNILAGFGQAGLAALLMGAAIIGWNMLSNNWHVAISSLGGVAAGGAVYGIMLLLLGAKEARQILGLVQKRVFKRL